VTACGAIICLGLLTFVLDLANSSRMVWGRSGSNLTPCCKKKQGVRHGGGAKPQRLSQGEREGTQVHGPQSGHGVRHASMTHWCT